MDASTTVAIVTGAGTGIGASTARRLLEGGATVALLGRRPDPLHEVAATAPERAMVRPVDVSDSRAVAAPLEVLAWEDDWKPGRRLDPAIVAPMRERLVRLHLAGAGLHSTVADLVRFGRAMLRGGELDGARILAPAFVDLMTREVTVDGLGRAEDRLLDGHYAIGWGKPGRTDPSSARAFEHGGATGTRLHVDPECDLVVVYLTGLWAHPGTATDEAVMSVYAALR